MTGAPLVIYNPVAGRGRVAREIKGLGARLPANAQFRASNKPGEAASIAEAAVRSGIQWIIAAGGDGTVHEVANGILASGPSDATFLPLPLGSMNDYAFTLGLQGWWQSQRDWNALDTMLVDVGVIRSGNRTSHFVNGCGIGFNGMVTTEALKIRWLRGVPLYALAVLKALVKHYRTPKIRIDTNGDVTEKLTLAFTVGLGQREGGFPLTALAKLDDGLFDTLQVGDIRRWELIRHLPGMISGWLPRRHLKLTFGQASRITFDSESPLCIHTDGEFFCKPEEGLTQVEVEILPRRLRVAIDKAALYGGTAFDALRKHVENETGAR